MRLVDANGIPTERGVRAMFEAKDEAEANRRWREASPPPRSYSGDSREDAAEIAAEVVRRGSSSGSSARAS